MTIEICGLCQDYHSSLHHIMLGLIEGKSPIMLLNTHYTVSWYCYDKKVTSLFDAFLKLNSRFEIYQ